MKIKKNGKILFDPESPSSLEALIAFLVNNDLLKGANLSAANLRDADFSGANFWAADLSGASLKNTKLRGVNFWGVDLTGADLEFVYLNKTNLREAKITERQRSQFEIVEDGLRKK